MIKSKPTQTPSVHLASGQWADYVNYRQQKERASSASEPREHNETRGTLSKQRLFDGEAITFGKLLLSQEK